MWFRSVIDSLQSRSSRKPPRQIAHSDFGARRITIEPLEDRRMLSFSPAASYLAGTYPQAIVSADFNNDGRLDLVTASAAYGADSVSVLLGNADGTFQAAQISPTGATPFSLAVGDFNADGKLDLVTANAYDLSVLLGNGNGTFQAPTSIGVGSSPSSVAVGDFNSDGKLDLGVTSNFYYPGSYGYYGWYPGSYAGYANVLLGTGTGSFAAPNTTYLGPGYCSSATVGQFNADGNQDFAAANSDYWTVSVLLGDGTGNLAGGSSFATGASPWSVTAGDVNGDLTTDLVTANYYNYSVSVLLGNGAGAFATAQNYTVGSYLSSVVLGDFDNDTTLDIATANVAGSSVLRGLGDGTFAPPENFPTGPGPYAVAAGDFNGDGWLDVATTNVANDTVSVLLNDGNWSSPPPPPSAVSVSDVMVAEGNTGTRAATFTVTLSAAAAGPVTVAYASADGSAMLAGSDYQATSGSLSFAPGETSKTITLLVKGDRTAESDETFLVNLSNAGGATIADGQGQGTILDDEPRISISDVSKKEDNSGTTPFVFTVGLSAAYDAPVTVKYATANGSATANGDYQATSGTITFAAGQTSKTVTVQVKGDVAAESDETFFVSLSNASGATIADGQGAGTILNDDYQPRISVGDVSRSEGNSGRTRFVFTVNLSAPSDSRVTVDYATADGTARKNDNDYVAKSGRLTFAPGQTSKTVTISVKGDKKQEADEAFFLNLGNAKGALIDDSQGLGTILNDDGVARGRNQLAFAAAVDAAFEDWMTPGRKKSGR